MTETKMESVEYNMYRWGPCLVRFKINETARKLFLSEGTESDFDYTKNLAGILKKEVAFKDYKKFETFFSGAFKLYNDALKKWTGSKDDDFNTKYHLNSLWCNFQGPGDFNPPHDHSDTLSFVIYLQVPQKLIEENKKYKGRSAGPGGITFLYGEGTRDAVTHHSFFPKENDMYIFPAWLKHWGYPFQSHCTRISVSGNVADFVKVKDLRKNVLEAKREKI